MAIETNNGYFRGKTEATLEGIAHKLDFLEERITNCPLGIENRAQIHNLEIEVIEMKGLRNIIVPIIVAVIAAALVKFM